MNTCLRFPGGRDRALTLSYDDGVTSDIPLAEILNAHGIRATFNINTAQFAEEGTPMPENLRKEFRRMTKSEALALYKNTPHEVAVHALSHPFLDQMPISLVTYEVMEDRKNIEEMFGTVCRGMAYPYGTSSDGVLASLRASGIAYSRTTGATERFDLPKEWLLWPSTCHHNCPRLFSICDSFLEDKPGRPPRVFYLWGHSYEFCTDNTWDKIEKFAEKMGGDDRIWYATNLEIHVHNPTATDLYFAPAVRSEEVICIPAGKTVEI